MFRNASRALAVLLLLAAPASGVAQRAPMMSHVDPALFHGMHYRFVGPNQGGRVTTVTGVPSQPRTFYMGVASGGLFKTTDGGESWHPITDGQVPLGSSGSVGVADSDPNVIYYGTGSDAVRSNVSTGRGVYKSVDGGKTWSFAGLRDVGQIGELRIDPKDPNTVWVAAMGDIFKPSHDRGIYKTTDGGKTWHNTLWVSDSTGAMDVELQPGNPDVVYAWMSRLERKPWTIISGSHEGGFYKSTDGGEHFQKMMNGLPHGLIGKANLAVTAADPQRIYALVEAKPGDGLYRSDDAGESWTLVNTTPGIITRPFYYTALGADPSNADVAYMGAETFYKTTDGGKTLTVLRTPHGDNHDIWINPHDGNTMIEANDGGANVSFDGGRTWSTQMNQPTAEIYGLHIDHRFPMRLYGAQQDDGTHIISSVAEGGVENVDEWPGPGCETGPVVPHPSKPNIVYGSCKGQFEVMDLNTGQSKQYWIGAQSLYGNPASDLIYRFQRVSPMETSPWNPNIVYYGSQYLHRTEDMGVHWERISPDLTAHPAGTQGVSGGPITRDVTGEEFYSTLYAIAESPHQAGVIWVGSNDGPFHITRDDGATWQDITPKDLPPGGRVAFIDVSPHRPGSAYYAVYRYLLGDYAPYIYLTNDYGKTWKRLTDGTNGIPKDTPTRVVREDPGREGLLYAGTEFGMYISFDNGGHWQPFDLNMPQVPINDIQVRGNDLFIATQGRSIWAMDDISSLNQITPQTSTDAVHLYAPRDGYRTNVKPELLGPMIDYYLPKAPSGAVTVEILDAGGNPVSSYSSATRPRPRRGRGGGGGFFGRRGPPPPTVTTDVGFNRMVWNVRDSDGITVPPGRYQARLTVDGASWTQPFSVLIDPRVERGGVSVDDLVDQYEHNRRMDAMVKEVRALVERVQTAMSSGNAATKRRLQPVADKLLTPPIRYSKPGLESQIGYLRGMTIRADQKIGQDAIDRYDELRKELDAVEAEANKVLGGG
ncbi:MAG: hypothetical protein LJF06_08770 [Gemmatimonadetes bacterium]|nr:hypothetical protein [Gemmatimonadota bacterium]